MRKRIWIPEAPMLNTRPTRETAFELPATGCAGHFEVELIHARTGIITRRLEFPNLITNAGMDAIGGLRAAGRRSFAAMTDYSEPSTGDSLLNWCAVGTGSVTPSFTQAALVSEVGRTNANGGFNKTHGIIAGSEYAYVRVTREFTEAQANGNLTEVGFFDAATGGTLFTYQLLKDANGQPTTVTKTNEYRLRVIYEFRVYIPTADTVSTAIVNGASRTITIRPIGITTTTHWSANGLSRAQFNPNSMQSWETNVLPASTATGPIGVMSANDIGSMSTYAAGNHFIECLSTFGGSRGVFATGIGTLGTWRDNVGSDSQWGSARFLIAFSDKIAKTNVEKLVTSHRASWARHTIPS